MLVSQPSSQISSLLNCLSDGLNQFLSVLKTSRSYSIASLVRASKSLGLFGFYFGFTSKSLKEVRPVAFISECKQKDNKLSGVTGMTHRLACSRFLPGVGPRWKTRGQSRGKNGALSAENPSHQLGLNRLKGGNAAHDFHKRGCCVCG